MTEVAARPKSALPPKTSSYSEMHRFDPAMLHHQPPAKGNATSVGTRGLSVTNRGLSLAATAWGVSMAAPRGPGTVFGDDGSGCMESDGWRSSSQVHDDPRNHNHVSAAMPVVRLPVLSALRLKVLKV
jgi:hypothetical protein